MSRSPSTPKFKLEASRRQVRSYSKIKPEGIVGTGGAGAKCQGTPGFGGLLSLHSYRKGVFLKSYQCCLGRGMASEKRYDWAEESSGGCPARNALSHYG